MICKNCNYEIVDGCCICGKRAEITLPLHTQTKDNMRGWREIHKKSSVERRSAYFSVKALKPMPEFPVRVVITRYGPRKLDYTNLGSAFKAIIDGIADAYGVDDRDERWEFVFKQQKKPVYAVKVQLISIE